MSASLSWLQCVKWHIIVAWCLHGCHVVALILVIIGSDIAWRQGRLSPALRPDKYLYDFYHKSMLMMFSNKDGNLFHPWVGSLPIYSNHFPLYHYRPIHYMWWIYLSTKGSKIFHQSKPGIFVLGPLPLRNSMEWWLISDWYFMSWFLYISKNSYSFDINHDFDRISLSFPGTVFLPQLWMSVSVMVS